MSLNQEQFDQLPDEVKSLYIENEGAYELSATPKANVDGLSANKERILAEKKALAKRNADLEAQIQASEDEKLKANQQFKELAENNKTKWAETQKQLDEYKQKIAQEKITNETQRIASELFGDKADVFAHHLAQYITYDDTSGVVYADSGAELTQEQLKEKIKGNARLSEYVVTSSATGGGSQGSKAGAGSVKSFNDMTGTEKLSLARTNPEQYQKLKQQSQGN